MVLKKQVANYSNNRLQINITKKDNLKANEEVFVYTSEEHNNITSRLASLKEEVANIKQQLEEANANIEDINANKQHQIEEAIEEASVEMEANYKKQLQDIASEHNEIIKQLEAKLEALTSEAKSQRSYYEDVLKDKNTTIANQQQTIQDKDNTITSLEAKAIDVNEVINKYNEGNIERQQQHHKEITALQSKYDNLVLKYNALRLAIINTSKWSYLFSGAKKQLLNDYREIPPQDKEAIEIEAPTQTDT